MSGKMVSFTIRVPEGFPDDIATQIGTYCRRRAELTMARMQLAAQLKRIETLAEIGAAGFQEYSDRQIEIRQEELIGRSNNLSFEE